jgi:UDP-3-O-[3-hydroxymyristoyl] glucosamine N-acyltransferase
MQITAAELAALLQGELVGDGTTVLNKVAKIEEGETGALSFLANPKYEAFVYTTQSSAVLVNKSFTPTQPVQTVLIKVEDAYAAFTQLLEQFAQISLHKQGISPLASIATSANIADNVYIGAHAAIESGATIGTGSKIFPQVYIGDRVSIGKNCILYPGVRVYHDCVIGDGCVIHAGAVIGSDGFGFAPLPDKSYKKIPQTGIAILENNVEVGANAVIDRATMGATILREGAKIDNLVQIAHNVEIGKHTVIAAQSGVAGSTKIGNYCIVGGQVGFAGHITIADGSKFGAQTGVSGSIKEEGKSWFGSPHFEYLSAQRSNALFKRLPELEKRLTELEKSLKNSKP